MSQLAKQRLLVVVLVLFSCGPLVAALVQGWGSPAARMFVFAVLSGLAVAALISLLRKPQDRP